MDSINKYFLVLKLFLIVMVVDFGNARELQINKLRGVTIRNWPYAERLNGTFEGFAVDIMNEIANIVGFEYELYFSPDGKYGIVIGNRAVGMIGEVFHKRADFAVADITVTDERKKYVDFTEPFIENGLSVLIQKSNIGNMKSFKDLADQDDIAYGAIRSGSTYHLFSKSEDPTIKKIYSFMVQNPEALVVSSREGVERVKNSKYAFILESSFAEFLTAKQCDLTYIEENLFPRQYAIALPKDSPLKELFNDAIRKMKSSGVLNRLKAKYWDNKCTNN